MIQHLFIHGQSSLISQFLQPTILEMSGIIKNPVTQNKMTYKSREKVKLSISKYVPAATGISQQGKSTIILVLNTFLKSLPVFLLNNFAEITP